MKDKIDWRKSAAQKKKIDGLMSKKTWKNAKEIISHNYGGSKKHPIFSIKKHLNLESLIDYCVKNSKKFTIETFINGDLVMIFRDGECVWENSI